MSSADNYVVAAIRHYKDAKILDENMRYQNAMCHYAFSAECAIKVLYEQMSKKNGASIGHRAENVWPDIQQYLINLSIMDSQAGMLLTNMSLPEKLFQNHPGRRYMEDILYTDKDMREAEDFTRLLQERIITMALDGLIS